MPVCCDACTPQFSVALCPSKLHARSTPPARLRGNFPAMLALQPTPPSIHLNHAGQNHTTRRIALLQNYRDTPFCLSPSSSNTVKMFKKDITSAPKQKLKSSVQRSLRQSLLGSYPLLNPYIDELMPKKASLEQMKLPERCSLYVCDQQPLFYQQDNGTLIPHLKLVHRFPKGFPTIRIDRGAIRFVLSGATLMAPGLTSPGGRLPKPRDGDEGVDEEGHWSRELEKGEPVVIMAEGKTEACAVGFLVAGTKEVKDKGKGPVVEEAHFLGDGLWRLGSE